jgi:hypothetical protein
MNTSQYDRLVPLFHSSAEIGADTCLHIYIQLLPKAPPRDPLAVAILSAVSSIGTYRQCLGGLKVGY